LLGDSSIDGVELGGFGGHGGETREREEAREQVGK